MKNEQKIMRNRNLVLLGLILLKFILQYTLIDPVYELHRDEFLHLDQARHLAWGYTSVPPVTSCFGERKASARFPAYRTRQTARCVREPAWYSNPACNTRRLAG